METEMGPYTCSALHPNDRFCCCAGRRVAGTHWVFGTDGLNYSVPQTWEPGDGLTKRAEYGAPESVNFLNMYGAVMYPLGAVGAPVAARTIVLPDHCKLCNHYNEYVGLEHLTPGEGAPPGYTGADMVYVCRTCRPSWDRKQRMIRLKEEAAEREYRKTDYGRQT